MKIKKYLLLLAFINFAMIVVYGIINFKISSKISEVNQQYFQTQQKEILIFEISKKILTLENQIYQATIIGINKEIIHYYRLKISDTLNEIHKLLRILKYGGEYVQKNRVNLTTSQVITKKLIIKKENFTPEINDIVTKLRFIEKSINPIFRKISNRNRDIKIHHIVIKREIKLLPSIFDRIIENLNRYLAITENELVLLKKEKQKLFNSYILNQFIFITLAILVNIFILGYIFQDLQKLYNELEYRLYHDNLTKLKNRIALEEDIKKGNGLVIIDIDDFSNINEMYGVKVGDEFLIEFAKILNKYEKNSYRVGSDEFAILLKEVKNIKKYAKNLYNYLSNTPIHLPSLDIHIPTITVKMGLAVKNELIKNATFGLKIAKDKNIPIYKVTQKDIKEEKERIEFSMTWTQKIKEGINKELFVPFVQAIVDKNREVVKYEVLMRLKENDKYIPPFYLDIAIKNRLYHQISKIIFKKAIEKYRYPISFNISYLDIENNEMKQLIYSTLKRIDASNITFEILENESIKDYDLFNNFIQKVKSYGAKIAIDDFGTGYSNFTRILEIKPDLIKIDGSLIKDIKNKNNQHIVQAIVNFAKSSDIKTVAEFVENEEIFEICKDLGIDYFQGYYFSIPKPM